MDADQFLIPTELLLLFLLFSVLRFESQRWSRAIGQGRRGSSDAVNVFATLSTLLGTLFSIAAIVFLFVYAGWQPALGTMILVFLVGLVASAIIGLLIGDSFVVQLLATLAMWPVSVLLAVQLFSTYT